MRTTPDRISVIIPCRDAEDWLDQTLRSVLNQTRPADEVIVVDNGSTDRSRSIAESHAADGVRLLDCGRAGAPAARNDGMDAATGDALMFLDADDLLHPGALAALERGLERGLRDDSAAVAACPWERLERVDGCWLPRPPSCAPRLPGQDDLTAWLSGWYHPPCSVLWSRAALERVAPWDEDLTSNQDGDMMMRALAVGAALIRTGKDEGEGRAFYRRLPGEQASLSAKRHRRNGVRSRMRVLEKVEAVLADVGTLPRYRAALATGWRLIAESIGDTHADLAETARAQAERLSGGVVPQALRTVRDRAAAGLDRLGGAWSRAGRTAVIPDTWRQGLREGDDRPVPAHPAGAEDAPLVSVVIPTYNRAPRLIRALRSVLEQDYRAVEVLVVDDGSTDGTAEAVRGLDDPRIRCLRQANQGVAAARNHGLRQARGAFIALLDSDDEWLPGKLSRQVARLRASPGRVGLVYTGVETLSGGGRREVWRPGYEGDIHRILLARNVLHGAPSSALIRREVIDTIGLFDTGLPAIEDYDFWLRLTCFYEVAAVDAVLTRYYDEGPGSTGHDQERRSLNFAANMAAREMLFQRYRHALRREGLEHLFLLDNAERRRRAPQGDPVAARREVLRAVKARPADAKVYAGLLPGGLRHRLRTLKHWIEGARNSAKNGSSPMRPMNGGTGG